MVRKENNFNTPPSVDRDLLEQHFLDVARTVDNLSPDETRYMCEGIPLADNHTDPYRTAIFGGDYDSLTVEVIKSAVSETDATIDGARFTFMRHHRNETTAVELLQHPHTTPIPEIPFCITPSGGTRPSATVSFEELVHYLGETVQFQRYNVRHIIDPREEEDLSFAYYLNLVVESINQDTKREVSQRIHRVEDPPAPMIDRTYSLDVQRINAWPSLATFGVTVRHETPEGDIKHTISIVSDLQKPNRAPRITNMLQSETVDINQVQTRFANSDPIDVIQTLEDSLSRFETAKKEQAELGI